MDTILANFGNIWAFFNPAFVHTAAMAPYIQSFETEKEKGFRNRSYLFAQIIYMFWALLLSSIGGVDENIWNFIVLTLFQLLNIYFHKFRAR